MSFLDGPVANEIGRSREVLSFRHRRRRSQRRRWAKAHLALYLASVVVLGDRLLLFSFLVSGTGNASEEIQCVGWILRAAEATWSFVYRDFDSRLCCNILGFFGEPDRTFDLRRTLLSSCA